ncbi:hypothetical protein VTK73DRAFT_5287 [Phialemonium thermophilum]|uniref:Uncharacterized protein n=1 Tax=Phialemonium thermophilum TaxID=223376 RepID=A0ABR3V271_9PEZI
MCGGQAVQFLSVLGGVLAAGALAHDAQGGHAVSQGGDLVVEVGAVPLLDHVVGGLLDGLLAVEVVVVVVVLHVGGRLPLAAAAVLGEVWAALGGRGGALVVPAATAAAAHAGAGARLALGRAVLEVGGHGDALELLLLGGGQGVEDLLGQLGPYDAVGGRGAGRAGVGVVREEGGPGLRRLLPAGGGGGRISTLEAPDLGVEVGGQERIAVEGGVEQGRPVEAPMGVGLGTEQGLRVGGGSSSSSSGKGPDGRRRGDGTVAERKVPVGVGECGRGRIGGGGGGVGGSSSGRVGGSRRIDEGGHGEVVFQRVEAREQGGRGAVAVGHGAGLGDGTMGGSFF